LDSLNSPVIHSTRDNKTLVVCSRPFTSANLLALTQAYLQQDYVQNDPVLNKASLEANKDLQKLLERGMAAAITAGAAPVQTGK